MQNEKVVHTCGTAIQTLAGVPASPIGVPILQCWFHVHFHLSI